MSSICIPGLSPVDPGPLQPLVDHPLFQRLRSRKQLGLNDLVFPGATHTRLEHTLGVLALTQRFCRLQNLPDPQALALQAFALLHDIGHGPFSHQIEPVLPGSHHDNGCRLIQQLDPVLRQCNLSAEQMIRMLQEKDPLATYVSDRNLGTDKLDYLFRDAMHIGFCGTPDIQRIQMATVMTKNGPALEEKFAEDAKMLQRFYSYLHQHGYLNKAALSAQRMLQRALQEMLCTSPEPTFSQAIWDMGDDELMQHLLHSESSLARQLAEALTSRQLYKSFLVLRPAGYEHAERKAEKKLEVLGIPRSALRLFCESVSSPETLKSLENHLADTAGLPHGSILVVAMPYFKKLLPKDLRIFSSGTDKGYWLLEKDPDQRKILESDYLRTFSLRLTCPEPLRTSLAGHSDLHKEIIRRLLPGNSSP